MALCGASTPTLRLLTAALAEATYLLLPEPVSDAPDAAAALIAEAAGGYDVLLAGCGLGQAAATATLLAHLLLGGRALPPLVLDADALNILAQTPDWWRKLPPGGVLTPHPGEMSRLTGLTVTEIQADRINLARRYTAQWGQVLVLKGANSVVAAPGGAVAISPFANPGLATAGTGDVLAGVVAGLIAQGVKPYPAAVLGVYLHATAAAAVAADIGAVGMLAGDLLPALPRAIKKLAGVQNAAGS